MKNTKYEIVIDKWQRKVKEFNKEREKINSFISEQFYGKFIVKAFRKTGLSKMLIPIDIEDRQYIVDFNRATIYIRDSDKYSQYLYSVPNYFLSSNHYNLVDLYKNYTQQYKDIELIFNILDDYFEKQDPPEWNTIEKIDEAVKFVKEHINELKLGVIIGDEVYTNKKILKMTDISFRIKEVDFYKDVLSHEDKINKQLKKLQFSFLKDFSDFLKNFEITKCLFFEINRKNFKEQFMTANHKIVHDQIKDLLKKTNTHLYEKLCQQEKEETDSKSASTLVWHNYSDFDHKLCELFYSPNFFKILLPKDFNIDGSRILVQVSFDELSLRKDLQDLQDIKIKFCFFNNREEDFYEINLYDFMNKLNTLSNIDAMHDKNRKKYFVKLANLIKTNRILISKYILNEIEERFGSEQVNNNLSLYESFLIDHMDKYLSNL